MSFIALRSARHVHQSRTQRPLLHRLKALTHALSFAVDGIYGTTAVLLLRDRLKNLEKI